MLKKMPFTADGTILFQPSPYERGEDGMVRRKFTFWTKDLYIKAIVGSNHGKEVKQASMTVYPDKVIVMNEVSGTSKVFGHLFDALDSLTNLLVTNGFPMDEGAARGLWGACEDTACTLGDILSIIGEKPEKTPHQRLIEDMSAEEIRYAKEKIRERKEKIS